MKILLAITFVFGVLKILTATKLFNTEIPFIIRGLFGIDNKKNQSFFKGLCAILDVWFFYFSLIFQSYYWIFNN